MDLLKEQLYAALKWFGPNDILTIMLSQKLDKLIAKEQGAKQCL